jgi:hypothetical protein
MPYNKSNSENGHNKQIRQSVSPYSSVSVWDTTNWQVHKVIHTFAVRYCQGNYLYNWLQGPPSTVRCSVFTDSGIVNVKCNSLTKEKFGTKLIVRYLESSDFLSVRFSQHLLYHYLHFMILKWFQYLTLNRYVAGFF